MIINVTKKATAVFNAFPTVPDSSDARDFSKQNSFYSWHANYYTVNHKKIVILINDLTYTPVILADINAKNKQNLPAYIREGISLAFAQAGLTNKQITMYFEKSDEWWVNAAFNRHAISVTNMYIQYAKSYHIDMQEMIQFELAFYLANVPISTIGHSSSVEELRRVFDQSVAVKPVVKELALEKEVSPIEKSWRPFSTWPQQDTITDYHQYQKTCDEIEANNKLLLKEFKNYLENHEGLSQRVVNRHVNYARLYLNDFLLYDKIHTPVTDLKDLNDFIGDWFVSKVLEASPGTIKSQGTALKKLYTFLYKANEISSKDLKMAKENISEGVDFGEYLLMEKENYSDFYF